MHSFLHNFAVAAGKGGAIFYFIFCRVACEFRQRIKKVISIIIHHIVIADYILYFQSESVM